MAVYKGQGCEPARGGITRLGIDGLDCRIVVAFVQDDVLTSISLVAAWVVLPRNARAAASARAIFMRILLKAEVEESAREKH